MENKSTKLKIAIIGANGKMGTLATNVVESMPNCALVAKINRKDNLDEALKATKPDIAIELTSNESVLYNSQMIISNKIYPIIGSSGLTQADIEALSLLCTKNNIGGIIAPNFSLGMALVTKIAKDFKHYYDEFSIIEFHHEGKKDKPSGTARYTAEILGMPEENICSIRSNAFVAKQQLYISSKSERILLDHESFDRSSFAHGISLCIDKIMTLGNLIVGLENIL